MEMKTMYKAIEFVVSKRFNGKETYVIEGILEMASGNILKGLRLMCENIRLE